MLWQAGIYVLLGLSLNIIVGYAGLFQLGHAAFYAIGAYTVGILNSTSTCRSSWACRWRSLVAGVLGYLISRPILHLRGDYLAIVTIAFGEIVRMLLVNNVGGITGGANGLFGIDQPQIFGFTFSTITEQLLPGAVLRRGHDLRHAAAGELAAGPRLDVRARRRAGGRGDGRGHGARQGDRLRARVGAGRGWPACSTPAGSRSISPDLGSFLESVIMFCIVVLGGTGSIPGVFVGTFGMVVLPEVFRVVETGAMGSSGWPWC